MTKDEPVVDVRQAAQALGMRENSTYSALREGRIAGARKVDGVWKIPASALEAFRQKREVSR